MLRVSCHAAGIVAGLLVPLYEGATAHPLLAFDPLKVIQVMSHEGCHTYGGVTTMILALLQHPDFDTYDLSSIKFVLTGGAPVVNAILIESHSLPEK